MKSFLAALILIFCMSAAIAEEPAAGEHEAKTPPPKPPAGSPVEQVEKLPVVAEWKKSAASYKSERLNVWGESLSSVEGQKCWGVAVGEIRAGGKEHIWRRFCVPVDGSEIWVEGVSVDPNADVIYLPYGKWVDQCKPTPESEGSC